MTQDISYTTKTKQLIDNLKSVCANYGLGNDGNEFKIISQVFLYKFLSDKYRYEVKKKKAELGDDLDEELLMDLLDENVPRFKPHQQIEHLHNIQNTDDFGKPLTTPYVTLVWKIRKFSLLNHLRVQRINCLMN